MSYEVNATDLGDKANSYLNNVRYRHNTCVIKQGAEEIAAIIKLKSLVFLITMTDKSLYL